MPAVPELAPALRRYTDLPARGPWVIRCAPGLARTALAELRFRRVLGRTAAAPVLRQRNHDLIFLPRADRTPEPILRIPEEIHYCLLYGRYKISNAQLSRLAAVVRAQRRPVRLVVTADGAHFPRQETRRWLAYQLQRLGVAVTDDEDALILWTFCIEEAYYITLLAASALDAPLRTARQAERQGALPPTIAAALAYLGVPRPDDTILDPVCGTGTLLAEAHAYAPDARLVGVDLDEAALAAARQNLEHAASRQLLRLLRRDGTKTGLPEGSVSLALANLPFGKQYGDRATNPQLYAALVRELLRVSVPGSGRAVLLSSDVMALDGVLAAERRCTVTKRVTVKIRGEVATIVAVTFA